MLVAELAGVRQFRLLDQSIPDPAPGQIQVEVKSIGICGSDLHYYADGGIGDTPCVYPMVLGHEPTGRIVKTGPGVTGWAAGDRAILEPAIYCYHCEFCMTGRHNVCANIRFLSTPAEPGFFRQFVNLPASNVMGLPEGLGYDHGTLFEPLAIVLHSMKFAALRPGETALVFGAGPIGLLTVAMLKLSGAGRIWSVEPVAERRALAAVMGADAVLDPASDAVRQVKHDTGGRGVDVVFDCAAKDGTLNQCLHVASNSGRVIYTGIPSEISIALDFHEMRRKELAIYNIRRSNHETDLALRLLASEIRRFAPIVTHNVALPAIASAFDMLHAYQDGATKVTLNP
ncbi:MAG: alcohol dehydrogenase catalytic domain-containing protein [Bryobacteraceae bacterium]|nr:alcohol dehydrogenase catalytic domain-containing protein [Bryobacteraceae bacterium]